MSIVGPRPERPEIAAEYEKEMPEFRLRLQARAGLTGYAQVYGKYNTTPYTADLQELFAEYKNLIIVIGNNAVRERIYDTAKQIGYNFPNLISPSAYVSPYAKLGWGCVILNYAVVQNGSAVGNGVLINPGVEIHHDCVVEDYALIYTNSVVRTYAKVGRCRRARQ